MYKRQAEQGLKGMMTLMSDKGDVTKICVGTGIMPSPAYYYNRPTQENDPMGDACKYLQGCCVAASYGMTDTMGRMHSCLLYTSRCV